MRKDADFFPKGIFVIELWALHRFDDVLIIALDAALSKLTNAKLPIRRAYTPMLQYWGNGRSNP